MKYGVAINRKSKKLKRVQHARFKSPHFVYRLFFQEISFYSLVYIIIILFYQAAVNMRKQCRI